MAAPKTSSTRTSSKQHTVKAAAPKTAENIKSPPRSFGQNKTNVNIESPPKGASKSPGKARSPIEEVAHIFKQRSPQPYGGPAGDKPSKTSKSNKSAKEQMQPKAKEAQKKGATAPNMTTFQDFNRRLDALKAKVMGDEEAWRKLNHHQGTTA